MKGVVFNILEAFIIETFGDETMEEIYSTVAFSGDTPPFIGPETYPDSDLFAMVTLLAEMKTLDLDDVIFELGEFMFPVFAKKYPIFFENIHSSIEFLKTVNDIIHVEVKKLFEDANPPMVKVKQTNEDSVKLYYYSDRKLCKLLEGLLEGLAFHFGQKVSYEQTICMKDGGDQCVYKINYF